MNERKYSAIIMLGISLFVVPVMLKRFTVEARATSRVFKEFSRVEAPVMKEDGGLPMIEKFAGDLKTINLNGTPQEVREAMARMIEAVEKDIAVRRAGGDTNASINEVVGAKRALVTTFDRLRGNPF